MDIRKEEDVSLNSPISPQEYSNTDAHHSFCASNPVDEDGKGDCDSRSPCEFNEPAILRPPPAPSLPNNGKEPVPNSTSLDEENRRIQDAIHTSAAAFVEGGIQDACDDSCSICLEPFCESDPAMVTSCKHNYHLQCILEWAQRSKECPMCWRLLSFEDPSSQELFDAVEQERFLTWGRHSTDGYHPHQVSTFATYADFFEERIMQHLAHQLARRGTLQNRGFSMNDGSSGVPPNQVLLRPNRAFLEQSMHAGRHADNNSSHVVVHGHSMNEQATNGSGRHNVASETTDDSQQRQDLSSLSESLKSRFLVASSK
ncbi:hypothetical protein KP509_21G067300 [Ceratopteris richardii]|nr:hypothetical protein KP509_21G067300 [Ceratopteris richardii]